MTLRCSSPPVAINGWAGRWTSDHLLGVQTYGTYVIDVAGCCRFAVVDADSEDGLARAGLPDMRFHDLRHSAATILLTMGVHPKVVQELLGHSSIAITMNVYSHLLPSMQTNAMGLINDVFKAQEEEEEGKN